MRFLFLSFILVLILGACGKTGALYLPEDKNVETPPAEKQESKTEIPNQP